MNPIQKIHQTSKRTYIKDNNLTNKSPNPLKHKEPSSNPLKQNEPNSENSSNTQKIYIKDNNLIKQNSNPLKQNKLSREKREREREREMGNLNNILSSGSAVIEGSPLKSEVAE